MASYGGLYGMLTGLTKSPDHPSSDCSSYPFGPILRHVWALFGVGVVGMEALSQWPNPWE